MRCPLPLLPAWLICLQRLNTPLHHAAEAGSFDCVDALLEAGAARDALNLVRTACPLTRIALFARRQPARRSLALVGQGQPWRRLSLSVA